MKTVDGIAVEHINHGWQNGYYLSEFKIEGKSILCRFKAAYYNDEHCHYPAYRLNFDLERLEHEGYIVVLD